MKGIQKNRKTLEERILIIQAKAGRYSVSVKEILNVLSGKGRSIILILLSLPFCQPIQIPGLSTPFGIAIGFVGLRLAFGKHVWLPKRVLAKTISSHLLKKMTSKALILLNKMKRWIHPRIDWACNSPIMQVVNGVTIAVLGIFLALPLPIPLSNLTAAWAILLITLGILEDDGIFILIGYAICLLTIVFFALITLLAKHHLLS